MSVTIAIFCVGLLMFLSHLFSGLFERTRIPDVLPLVALGVLAGPVFHLVRPEHLGKVGNVFAVVTLVLILFQGGMDLNFTALRHSLVRGTWLTILNFAATMAVLSVLGRFVFQFSWIEGMMLGAILGGTSSAVVMPMVARLPLQEKGRVVLILESTFSDVLCIVGTIALLQVFRVKEAVFSYGAMAGQVAASFVLAALLGAAGAYLWANLLGKVHRLKNSAFLTPAFVFMVYGITEMVGWSGGIAALSFGVFLGNIANLPELKKLKFLRPIQPDQIEKIFFGEIVFMLKTFFFLYIGVSVQLDNPWLVGAGFMVVVVVLLIRIPVVRLSLDKTFTRFDASIASIMVPKGLAAAVLASLPLQAGALMGNAIQGIVYATVLLSIIAVSIMSLLIERKLLQSRYDRLFAGYPENVSAPETSPATVV